MENGSWPATDAPRRSHGSNGSWDAEAGSKEQLSPGLPPVDNDERAPFLAPLSYESPATRSSSSSSRRQPWVNYVLSAFLSLMRSQLFRKLLALFFLFFICWIAIFMFMLPVMNKEDRARLKVPASLAEVQEMYKMLGEYRTKNYWAILIGFSSTYIFKNALALPGSPLFNLLGGALFGVWVGFAACVVCTGLGTALCYLFYNTFGGPLVRRLFMDQLNRLDTAVQHHKRRLFYYLTVIRIFPMTPNFFINLAAPLIRLPFVPHTAAATIGLAPITFLTCQAGQTLSTLESVHHAVDKRILMTLAGLAVCATLPLLLRRRVEESLETLTDTEPIELPEELRGDTEPAHRDST